MIRPLNKYVVIKQDDPPSDKTDGGLILLKVKPRQSGVILAIGSKVKDVQVGDHVEFQSGEFKRHTVDGEEILIVLEDHIIGVYTE